MPRSIAGFHSPYFCSGVNKHPASPINTSFWIERVNTSSPVCPYCATRAENPFNFGHLTSNAVLECLSCGQTYRAECNSYGVISYPLTCKDSHRSIITGLYEYEGYVCLVKECLDCETQTHYITLASGTLAELFDPTGVLATPDLPPDSHYKSTPILDWLRFGGDHLQALRDHQTIYWENHS